KVPATIVSRCQRFDFRRIPDDELGARVEMLVKEEGATIDAEVVKDVVRHADGCVRDAETLLDQLLALGEKKLTKDVASLVMPVSRIPIAAKLLEICGARTLGPALAEIARLEGEGIPFVPLFDDLIRSIRFLLIASGDDAFKAKLAAGDEGEQVLARVVGTYGPAELSDMALLFMERRRDAKQGIDPRFSLELGVTSIALGVLPNGPGSSKQEGTIVAMNVATPVIQSDCRSCEGRNPSDIGGVPDVATSAPQGRQENIVVESTGTSSLDMTLVRRKWNAVVKAVAEKCPSLNFILTISRPESVEGTTVFIRFQYPFHKEKIVGDAKNKRLVEDIMQEQFGCEVCIDGLVGEDPVRTEKRSEDMVSNIIRAFGGQMVE
ncbi:MAG: hypothetical protein V1745_04575, partial [Patescibacteria group bacterium]